MAEFYQHMQPHRHSVSTVRAVGRGAERWNRQETPPRRMEAGSWPERGACAELWPCLPLRSKGTGMGKIHPFLDGIMSGCSWCFSLLQTCSRSGLASSRWRHKVLLQVNPQEKDLPCISQTGAVIVLLHLEAALGMTYLPTQGRVSPTRCELGFTRPHWQLVKCESSS